MLRLSGFCRQRLMRWCERHQVGYILGVARNARLEAGVSRVELAMSEQYAQTGSKQREIGQFWYAADSWDHARRVITRLEFGAQGTNPRLVVTNAEGEPGAPALQGTELARACAATIRTKLLKIGVGVLRNTRRVRRMFASHHPLRELFALAAARLAAASP